MSGSTTGNQAPNWGTKGIAAASNDPGGRQGMQSWQDASGNLYVFGGSTLGFEYVLCNDMWKYDISTLQWTWLGGPSTCNLGPFPITSAAYASWELTAGNQAVFGTLGTAASTNIPANRRAAATWVDASGKFWMFGGIGYDNLGNANLWSDLWRYDPSTGFWTWMGGPNTPNQSGVYGTQGTGSTSNYPGGRQEMAYWADAAGNFWLFGGQSGGSYFNDLWKYNVTSGQWTWVSGSNTANATAVYGTQGTAAAGNVPNARKGTVGWVDSTGKLWLFGGDGIDAGGGLGTLGDLWKY